MLTSLADVLQTIMAHNLVITLFYPHFHLGIAIHLNFNL